MVVSSQEKTKLVAYQLRDVAQVWYEQWKDERPVRKGTVTWTTFKMTLHEGFSPL